jgi:NADPH-dependent curcumin reductase CurA
MMAGNRRWVLAERPAGIPDERTFRLETVEPGVPGDGQVLVRNRYIPVDPGIRPALAQLEGDPSGDAEFTPFPLGDPVGFFTVGQVVESRHPALAEGDWVTGAMLWQDYAVVPGATILKIDVDGLSPTAWLGPLGIPGLSAWTGMVCCAEIREGDVVIVTSAAGSVGLLAGQVARNRGCTVVGVAGGPRKCTMLVEDYGFAAAIDYRAEPDLAAAFRRTCPQGADVFFDNVGNAMINAAMPIMRNGGRITICGQIGQYNLPPGQRPGLVTDRFVSHRLSLRGLFVFDHAGRFAEAREELGGWLRSGKLLMPESVIDGFENVPGAFRGIFTGQSAGRTIIRVGQDECSAEPRIVPES